MGWKWIILGLTGYYNYKRKEEILNTLLQALNQTPVHISSDSVFDGPRPGSANNVLGPTVTAAPKTVGAYLQTSTRQLVPDSKFSLIYLTKSLFHSSRTIRCRNLRSGIARALPGNILNMIYGVFDLCVIASWKCDTLFGNWWPISRACYTKSSWNEKRSISTGSTNSFTSLNIDLSHIFNNSFYLLWKKWFDIKARAQNQNTHCTHAYILLSVVKDGEDNILF